MRIEILKSKIHRAKLTQAELHYVGSITIDEALMEAANIIENEKVQVVNVNNGERLETYVIKGKRNSGVICLNGPAAIGSRRCAHGGKTTARKCVPRYVVPRTSTRPKPQGTVNSSMRKTARSAMTVPRGRYAIPGPWYDAPEVALPAST